MQSKVPSTSELPRRMQPDQDNTGGSREKQCLVLRATAAAQTLANIIRPCFGPYGRQKFLVTGDGETVCTGDAASILRVLELDHPAAQLVQEAARTQMEISGDSVAFVVLLTEALLEEAELLLQAGLPRTQLQEAFATAFAEALVALPSLSIRSLGPLEDPSWVLYSVMSTQTLSNIEYLTKLVAHVCWAGRESEGTFRPERVALCLIEGGRTEDSCILPGLAIAGKPCGQITAVLTGARVALYVCDFGPLITDAPATPRLSSEEELRTFRRQSEEMENEMTQLATMDINVAVVWGKISKKMLTQANKADVMVIQAKSRKDMTYLSEVTGTPLLTRLIPPLKAGKCQKVYPQDVGNSEVILFEWTKAQTPAFTVVLRAPTTRGLRAMEQAIYHGIDVYSQLCQDPRLLPGAGATEMALSRILTDKGRQLAGPNGPVFLAFARALRSLPRALAENAGLAVQHVLAEMNGLHQAGNFLMGVGAEGLIDVTKEEVWDILKVKAQGLQVVAEVVQQLVTVDEIILAKKRPVSGQIPVPDAKEERAFSSQRKKFFGNYTC